MTFASSRVAAILMDLVAIPSVNPTYDPASRGEYQMAAYIERWADEMGLNPRRQAVFPGRDNVIARLEIDHDAPTLLFEAHMDTVGVVPGTLGGITPIVRDGKLFGRGSCDTKGAMAAMMTAIERLGARRDRLGCNIEFLAAVDEESRGTGASVYAKAHPQIDAAIVGEPTELRIVNGHKGVIRGRITILGRAAHTSVAHEGVNAIDGAADVIVALRAVSRNLTGGLTGGSFTVSLIEGGNGINIVPEACSIYYDQRTVPGDTEESVASAIEQALDRIRAARHDVLIERSSPDLVVAPLNTSGNSAIVIAATSAAASLGQNPEPALVPYGSDASMISAVSGIPCIVYGPGSIAHAHGADEFVPLNELNAAAQFYESTAHAFGRKERRA